MEARWGRKSEKTQRIATVRHTFDVIDILEAMAADFLQLLDSSLLGKLLHQLHNALVKVMPLKPPVGGHSLLELMEDLRVS